MKTLIPFILLFNFCNGQNVYIPDVNFKSRLLELGTLLDSNADGEIQITEANNFSYGLILPGNAANPGNISDLTGIEAFVNLPTLQCSYNQLTTLNVNSNTQLLSLVVNNNNLTSINLNNLTQLTELNCSYNHLEMIDISDNILLASFECGNNDLNSLDVTANANLTSIACETNNISNINLTNCPLLTSLNIDSNQLTSLDVSSNSVLTLLACGNNQISTLNLTNNSQLNWLLCYNNNLASVDLDTLTALLLLDCGNNPLSNLNVSNNTNLTNLSCASTSITSLDLSNNANLTRVFCISNYNLVYINLKNGANGNISTLFSRFGFLPVLQAVCVDAVNSPLATFIQNQVIHPITLTETCELSTIQNSRSSILLYPNPVSNFLNIESENALKSISVYNALGQFVIAKSGEKNIDLSALNSGIYTVKVIDCYQNLKISQIVKN